MQPALSAGPAMSRRTPLLCLHGWGADGSFFGGQQPLADRFELICPSLHGADVAQDLDGMTAHVAAAIDRAQPGPLVGLGWSMGALPLWRLAADPQAARFAALIIVDMSPRVANDADWTLGLAGGADAAMLAAQAELMCRDWPGFAAATADRLFAASAPDRSRLVAFANARMLGHDPVRLASAWRALVAEDARPLLPRITVPTLVVAGTESSFYAAEVAAETCRRMPHAEAALLSGCGHAPHMERPESFNALIADFIARATRPTMNRAHKGRTS